jgi:hypothetical protein
MTQTTLPGRRYQITLEEITASMLEAIQRDAEESMLPQTVWPSLFHGPRYSGDDCLLVSAAACLDAEPTDAAPGSAPFLTVIPSAYYRNADDKVGPVDLAASTASQQAQVSGPISTPMVAALEQAWADIRTRHSDVPAAVIVLGAGSVGAPSGGLKLGHFAAMRWRTDAEGADVLAEVFVGGEGLIRGSADVLGTLLHEAAHAVAHVRGIKDTSRQGRWHNARFKALAEELGVEVTKDPRIGWSPTTITDATRQEYAGTIVALSLALRMFRSVEVPGGSAKKPSPPPCVCGCGRRIRVARSVLEAGPITCGMCGSDFAPEEPES